MGQALGERAFGPIDQVDAGPLARERLARRAANGGEGAGLFDQEHQAYLDTKRGHEQLAEYAELLAPQVAQHLGISEEEARAHILNGVANPEGPMHALYRATVGRLFGAQAPQGEPLGERLGRLQGMYERGELDRRNRIDALRNAEFTLKAAGSVEDPQALEPALSGSMGKAGIDVPADGRLGRLERTPSSSIYGLAERDPNLALRLTRAAHESSGNGTSYQERLAAELEDAIRTGDTARQRAIQTVIQGRTAARPGIAREEFSNFYKDRAGMQQVGDDRAILGKWIAEGKANGEPRPQTPYLDNYNRLRAAALQERDDEALGGGGGDDLDGLFAGLGGGSPPPPNRPRPGPPGAADGSDVQPLSPGGRRPGGRPAPIVPGPPAAANDGTRLGNPPGASAAGAAAAPVTDSGAIPEAPATPEANVDLHPTSTAIAARLQPLLQRLSVRDRLRLQARLRGITQDEEFASLAPDDPRVRELDEAIRSQP